MKKIGIMGVGMVGGAMQRFFEEIKKTPVITYDPGKGFSDQEEINRAEIIFICVPTPFNSEKNNFDTVYLDEAFSILAGSKIIVIKSTVLPGTTVDYQKKFFQHKILFSPEFLTEATADKDVCEPNRQIVGYTKESQDVAEEVMAALPRAPFEKIITAEEAEMVKYYNNCFYALKVAYVNQIYDLCQKLGIDYNMVKECAKAEPMMGTNHFEVFHKGYRGYGGKCLPKDVRALIRLAKDVGVDLSILKQAEEYNNDLVSKQK
ncbi:MAG: UDP-glucose/GDP-mannose dehydrogenase family protein [Candidatus Magasanikbacteria bacterium]|nr:UDP-glucose/GDP-mannose dehydrogenase family protein [Candidatus Magasanikbacteria bacterium]MBI5412936.1 UDP-glucose/GDP-mannose dehydrogenase family protein [Candidatus Peregrinibacteria bacterium]